LKLQLCGIAQSLIVTRAFLFDGSIVGVSVNV